MPFDYTFFQESLTKVRRLRSLVAHPGDIFNGAAAIGTPEQLERSPKLIWEAGGDSIEMVCDLTNYARTAGGGLERLGGFLGCQLPGDFLDFHRLYSEALIVTRSYPMHIWSEDRILREAADNVLYRKRKRPYRFFRIGEYYDHDAQMFGLWEENCGSGIWRVVVTDHYTHDSEYDRDNIEPVLVRGASFYQWLKWLVEKDGLPDPFFEVGEEGGYLDPA